MWIEYYCVGYWDVQRRFGGNHCHRARRWKSDRHVVINLYILNKKISMYSYLSMKTSAGNQRKPSQSHNIFGKISLGAVETFLHERWMARKLILNYFSTIGREVTSKLNDKSFGFCFIVFLEELTTCEF